MSFYFRSWKRYASWLLFVLLGSCVDPFEPEVIYTPNSLLVVNGFINSNGPTTIQLLRTQNLTDVGIPVPEGNAQVYLEEEGGFRLPLTADGHGTYTTNTVAFQAGKRYRVHLYTAGNKEYASEYVSISNTPEIDNITWKAGNDKLQIYANTHNTADQTRYYRWQYEETWEFRSAYGTYLEYKNNKMHYNFDDINRCWRTEHSTEIVLGNTLRLSQNIVADQPILTISPSSPKINRKYSILVKQFAQTPEEYQYWETLKKNTENIGTLFDPLPTQLTGNIQCLSNPAEPVIGYIGAYSITEKRIFISYEELPENWRPRTGYESCSPPDTVANTPADLEGTFGGGGVLPVAEIIPPGGREPTDYTYATKECVDCRVRGTNIRPDFWQ